MQLPNESNHAFNLIAVGAWNPAILSPQWTKSHLVPDADQDVVMAIPMNIMGSNGVPRLTAGLVNLYPSAQSLMLDCVEFNDDSLRAVGDTFGRLCDLLLHTPITAVGINFRYTANVADESALAEVFSFSDSPRINANAYAFKAAGVRRSFNLQDGSSLNLTIENVGADITVEFNFHVNVGSATEARDRATADMILAKKAEALRFLSEVYEAELD